MYEGQKSGHRVEAAAAAAAAAAVAPCCVRSVRPHPGGTVAARTGSFPRTRRTPAARLPTTRPDRLGTVVCGDVVVVDDRCRCLRRSAYAQLRPSSAGRHRNSYDAR